MELPAACYSRASLVESCASPDKLAATLLAMDPDPGPLHSSPRRSPAPAGLWELPLVERRRYRMPVRRLATSPPRALPKPAAADGSGSPGPSPPEPSTEQRAAEEGLAEAPGQSEAVAQAEAQLLEALSTGDEAVIGAAEATFKAAGRAARAGGPEPASTANRLKWRQADEAQRQLEAAQSEAAELRQRLEASERLVAELRRGKSVPAGRGSSPSATELAEGGKAGGPRAGGLQEAERRYESLLGQVQALSQDPAANSPEERERLTALLIAADEEVKRCRGLETGGHPAGSELRCSQKEVCRLETELAGLKPLRLEHLKQLLKNVLSKKMMRKRVSVMAKMLREARVEWAVSIKTSHNVMIEFAETEKAYLDTLHVLQDVFFPAMAGFSDQLDSGQHMHQAFGRISVALAELYQGHAALAGELHDIAFLRTGADASIAEIVHKLDRMIRGSYGHYLIHLDKVIQSIGSLQQRSPEFAEAIKTAIFSNTKKGRGLGVQSFLCAPVRRMAGYITLVERLSHVTDSEHLLHQERLASLAELQAGAQYCDLRVGWYYQVQKLIERCEPSHWAQLEPLLVYGQRIWKEGELLLLADGVATPHECWLLTGFLVIARGGADGLTAEVIDLEGCECSGSEGPEFVLKHPRQQLQFRHATQEGSVEWVEAIGEAQTQAGDQIESIPQKPPNTASAEVAAPAAEEAAAASVSPASEEAAATATTEESVQFSSYLSASLAVTPAQEKAVAESGAASEGAAAAEGAIEVQESQKPGLDRGLDLEKMSFMALKKHLIKCGVPRQEADKHFGKEALLELARERGIGSPDQAHDLPDGLSPKARRPTKGVDI